MSSPIACTPSITTSRSATRVETHHVVLAVVVVGSLFLYAYSIGRFGRAGVTADGYLYYVHAHSWYFDGDCDYANNVESAPKLDARAFYLAGRSANGRVVNVFPCGWSLVALPFVAIADGATWLHNAIVGGHIPRDGYTLYYRAIVPLGHVLLGIAGMLVVYALAARYFSKSIAAAATALVWVGTNAVYFVSVEPAMSHAASFAFVAMMVWFADTIGRDGWSLRRAAGLGLCTGMMVAVRHSNVAWCLVPVLHLGLPLATAVWRRRPGAIGQAGLAALAVAVACACLGPQIAVNLANHGSIGSMLYFTPEWAHPRIARELFAWPSGLVMLYPIVGVCLLGAGLLAWRNRGALIAPALMIGFAAILYINSCGRTGASRRYTCGFVVFVLGLAAVLHWAATSRKRGIVVGVLIGGACARNIALFILVNLGLIHPGLINSVSDESPHILDGIIRLVTTGLPV